MDFELSEPQKMFQASIRNFVQKEIVPIVNEAEAKEECPRDVFSKLGELGYLCPAYPPEYDGGGLGKIGDCILCEEIASVCAGINSGIASQSGLATYAILAYGTDEQKHNFLMPAVRGEKIAAFGLSEPNVGSDVASTETTARREGDYYILNGTKTYITNGTICDFTTVAVSTDRSQRHRGLSVILVERNTPGFTINRMKASGFRSASGGELVFEECRVPAENLIGEEGMGFKYIMQSLNGGRITHSAGSVGRARGAYEAAFVYAKQRIQFGQPISKFQAIAFKLARLATDIEAARTLLYRVAWLYDRGERVAKEASMTKLFSSEVAIRAAEESMRIHAGVGYLAESKVHQYFRDNILSHATEGTTEMQLLNICRELEL
jgi:alkylation response protein AidB-like acyl-CoA dehydrogenase